MGGSTNVALHSVEIARAAGLDLWKDVMSQDEFNALSHRIPVLINARPFGFYSMVDIAAKGGLQVIVKQLLDAGFLDGSTLTCTGETLAEQVGRLAPPVPDGDVIHPVAAPFKKTGGLRLLRGNLAPEGGAILKVAGVEGGIKDGVFTGRARVFNSEPELIRALEETPDVFADHDMGLVTVRDFDSEYSRPPSRRRRPSAPALHGTPLDPQRNRIQPYDAGVFEECMRTRGYERVPPRP